jgi:hypothetical protein
MNVNEIVQQLRDERSKLDAAILALEGVSGGSGSAKRRGRPPGSINKQTATSAPKKRRTMSAAARKLISEAQKARWAKQKRAAKK